MTTTAPPTLTACLRFLEDGMTLDGQTWRAGAVIETHKLSVALLDPDEQRSRWGCVFFELITHEEFAAFKDRKDILDLRPTRRATPTATPPAMGHDANGERLHVDPGKATPLAGAAHTLQPLQVDSAPERLEAKGIPAAVAAANPWAWYEAASDLETVQHLAGMGEVEQDNFLAHERENRNRAGIIRLITTGEM